jgi:hypothetical protein
MSTVTAISFKPKATRKRLKKEILSDDFKIWKIFWKNIAENFMENFPPHITTLTSYEAQIKVNKCSELSSGMYCRVKRFCTDVSVVRNADIIRADRNVGRQSFYTAVHPRRQL